MDNDRKCIGIITKQKGAKKYGANQHCVSKNHFSSFNSNKPQLITDCKQNKGVQRLNRHKLIASLKEHLQGNMNRTYLEFFHTIDLFDLGIFTLNE